jgi:uncharacterized protein YjiS (DUF1127 family)
MAYIVHHPLTNSQPFRFGFVKRLVERLATWRRRSVERDQLARLDDRELRDIGVSRSLIYWELAKPFWRE